MTKYGCVNVCGLVIVTSTVSCFGYQKLIKGPTRPKFIMSLLTAHGCDFVIATPTNSHSGYQKLSEGSTRLEFGMWSQVTGKYY